ncbi:MurR/RpiR family transcriptional regulator [Leifsonia shinshuensis]|uniref:MurR/RpiR family transcriptional regulator n=1 Tax=Leifsonia shinshuensis TaxID=150026 RepID=UPI001F513201|nr:MurR/RpiR family transcriptional regulator [Leifsonia shinshuensis]MCI0158879.1 MurR/RpiR family transcriptional regulator [Leifsonia shinshuensis]
MSIQTSIQSHVDSFPPTMRRVADVILERPQIVMENTISELARACDTSEASIVRFCRALGFTGYPQLKLQLAAELAKESAEFGGNGDGAYGADISPSDTLAEMVAKIAGSEILGIRETADSLDMEVLQRVIRKLERAKRVVLFGVGASNAGAQDLAQKLLRIGHVALAFHDAHDALVSAALVEQGDVAIGFSHNGRTRETMAFLSAARRNGAHTVAVTNVPDSPLAEQAESVLRTAVRETTFRSGAMASRIAQLTIIDYLFVGVARGRYDRTVQALKSTYEIVKELRGDS